ncbi:MAG TPA: hypothetical protein DIT07_02650 [Sphingobacteriaceae bacterium]|nr:hypothetical protein [Sphingobacteriaceae bacterium]
MKIIAEKLYLEFSEMVQAGVQENTIRLAKHRNSSSWNIIDDPADKRKVLIEYEALRLNYKKDVQARYGDPYDYVAKDPIRKLVKPDFKAEEFFLQYRYDDNKVLPIDHRKKYTTAASWLNMLLAMKKDKKFIKKELMLSLEKFYQHVESIIETDKIDLPGSSRRLRAKMDEYKNNGYESLIDWRFGNKLSAKIGKGEDGFDPELADKQRAFILKAASMHNNFDAMQITRAVNLVFEKQGWPCISHGTVYNLCKENSHLTMPGRRGKREYNNRIAMQNKRKAPQFPMQYYTLDGWTVELLYQDETGYNNRLVVCVVLDACGKYPVGYAIGDRESVDLIKMANRNAAQHVEELFGGAYRPRQIQSDHYGLKSLTPFYGAMAYLVTPAAVGNAKSKIIEPYFMYLNKNYCQPFPFWSGFGVTGDQDNQPNIEYLDKIKHSFPDRAGVEKIIHMIIRREREIKQEEYLSKWNLLPVEERLTIQKEDALMIYGRPTGYTNAITGQGLLPTINGTKYTYDSFDPAFRALRHLPFKVIYDETDLSQVLVMTEDNKHKFVLDQKRELPMAVHDMVPEDHQYLSQVKDFNKARVQEVMDTYAKNDALVDDVMKTLPLNLNDYDEAALKLMFTYSGQQKNRLQDAKGLKKVQAIEEKRIKKEAVQVEDNWQQMQQNYLQSKTDFNQYLD